LVDSIELCDDIVSNTNNAVEVLNDLLNYDKIEVGGLSLELSYVAVEDVVESVLKPFKNPAKQKGVEIVLDVSQYMRSVVFPCCIHDDKYCALRVVGDKVRLEQVIRNLVSNALKFCAPNGQITVVVTWEEEGLEAPHTLPSQLDKFLHQAREPFPGGRGNRSASGLGVNDRAVSLATLGSVRSSGGDTVRLDQRSVRVRPGLEDSTSMTVRMSGVPGTSTASSARELTPAPSRRAVKPAARYRRSASEFYSSCRRGSVRVSVTDDGAGLTVEQQREFSSAAVNFDAKELQAAQGSGLGLVIAKGMSISVLPLFAYFLTHPLNLCTTGIVQQHGGLLTVESKGPQQGSTFTVEVPVFSCDLFTPEENNELRIDGPWEERVKTYRSFGAPTSRDGLGAGVGEAARDRGVRQEAETSAAANSDHSAPAATYETTTPADGSSGGHSPVERPAATQPTMATELASEPQGKPLLRRVLLVDDVASNLKMAARILQRSGVVECAKAEDGQIAVDAYVAARALAQQEADLALRQQRAEEGGEQGNDVSAQEPVEPFDAILMDFEMPVMNGPSATAKLRALGCTAPIIGITGNVLPADVEFFLQSGANAVLPKPLRLPDLYDALQR
jgi:signal transduction histidine kinase